MTTTRTTHLLFDYDNTLGGTEWIAFVPCCNLVNATLVSKGVAQDKLFTPQSLMANFVGFNFRQMISKLAVEHGFTFDDTMTGIVDGETFVGELEILVKREEVDVIAQLAKDIQPTAGVNELLARLAPRFNLSVVSSSAERRLRACLAGAGQTDFFPVNQVFSAVNYRSSKPDPLVYLEAMKALGVPANQCVAIEDSKSGAKAAVAAGIPLIGYLGAYPLDEQQSLGEKLREVGAKVIISDWCQFEAALQQLGVHAD